YRGACAKYPLPAETWSGLRSKCEFCARFCNLFRDHRLCCNLWSYRGLVQICSSGGHAPATSSVCVKLAGAMQGACPGRAVCVCVKLAGAMQRIRGAWALPGIEPCPYGEGVSKLPTNLHRHHNRPTLPVPNRVSIE